MPDGVTGSLRRQQLFVAGWRPQSTNEGTPVPDMVWVGTTESAARTEKFASYLGESWSDWNEVCSLEEFASSTQPELASFRQAIQAATKADERGKGHDVVRFTNKSRDQKTA